MNHVTFETAKRMEAAGCPKPEIQFGQFWYFPGKKKEVVITGLHDEGDGHQDNLKYIAFSWQGTDSDLQKEALFKHFTFLPTATDILKELPLERLEFGIDYKSGTGESWSVGKF